MDLNELEAALTRANMPIQQLLSMMDSFFKMKRANERFYVLVPSTVTLSGGIGTVTSNGNTVTQGTDADVVITDMSKYSTADFSFNFKLSGGGEYFFSNQLRGSALFLGTLPYKLTRPIGVTRGSGITFDLTNQSGSSNDVQLIFIGYKVFDQSGNPA